ncbi:unnamed protein product [Pieris brassicae]|uniref:Uncharacterized protein n=1 Tax=Pieris brassicae TaxID=7116 RepID=A0A9P0TS38_PIEBR|nr:unnamed protein product [Pieris brassicae]
MCQTTKQPLITSYLDQGCSERLRPFVILCCCVGCQHRPLRYCRYGHDGVDITATASCYRAAAAGSCNKTYSRFYRRSGYRTIHKRS